MDTCTPVSVAPEDTEGNRKPGGGYQTTREEAQAPASLASSPSVPSAGHPLLGSGGWTHLSPDLGHTLTCPSFSLLQHHPKAERTVHHQPGAYALRLYCKGGRDLGSGQEGPGGTPVTQH